MRAKSGFDRIAFVLITQNGRRPMRVDVLNLVAVDARISQGIDHTATRAIHIGCCHVVGITAHAKPQQFAVNLGTPLFCMFQLFKDNNARALSQNKAISVHVPRA